MMDFYCRSGADVPFAELLYTLEIPIPDETDVQRRLDRRVTHVSKLDLETGERLTRERSASAYLLQLDLN